MKLLSVLLASEIVISLSVSASTYSEIGNSDLGNPAFRDNGAIVLGRTSSLPFAPRYVGEISGLWQTACGLNVVSPPKADPGVEDYAPYNSFIFNVSPRSSQSFLTLGANNHARVNDAISDNATEGAGWSPFLQTHFGS